MNYYKEPYELNSHIEKVDKNSAKIMLEDFPDSMTYKKISDCFLYDKVINSRWFFCILFIKSKKLIRHLYKLSQHKGAADKIDMLYSIADNSNCPSDILFCLSQNNSIYLKWKVATNNNAPTDILLQLAKNEAGFIAGSAALAHLRERGICV